MFTIERVRDKLLAKYNRMNAQSNKNKGNESEKELYVLQIKGKSYSYGKYVNKTINCMDRKENKSCTYYKKD